jgi:hypothetical protein
MDVKRNIEAHSRNHCYREKTNVLVSWKFCVVYMFIMHVTLNVKKELCFDSVYKFCFKYFSFYEEFSEIFS